MTNYLIVLAVLLGSSAAFAHSHPTSSASNTIYKNDKWNFGYDYSYMRMEGLRDGTDDLSTSEAFARGYSSVPTKMNMQMHTGSISYQPNRRFNLTVAVPYINNDMDMLDSMGMTMRMASSGIGDVRVTGQYGWLKSPNSQLHLVLGASLPTGSTDESDAAMGRLPYMMQLGSGTYDPIVGLTYWHNYGNWTLGANAEAIIRTGENDQGYRFGNQYRASLSAQRGINRYLAGFVRLDGKVIDDIHGQDDALMIGMDPANDPKLQGSERIDAAIGINLLKPEGMLQGSHLALEFGLPVYQHLNGPQLETDYWVTAGLRVNF